MKKCKVKVTRYFKDKIENVERNVNDEFLCDKERYEFLKKNNAVELIGIVDEEAIVVPETIVEEIVNEVLESDEIQVTIDEAIEEAVDELIKKKSNKKKK